MKQIKMKWLFLIILLIILIGLSTVGIVISVTCFNKFSDSTIQNELEITALTLRDKQINGTVDEEYIDSLQDKHIELSIFTNDNRTLTSLVNNSERYTDSLVNSDVWKAVSIGNDYTNKKISLLGKTYYGYYVPIFGKYDKIDGIVEVLLSRTYIDNQRLMYVSILSLSFFILSLLLGIISWVFFKKIYKGVESVTEDLGELAKGNYKVTVKSDSTIIEELETIKTSSKLLQMNVNNLDDRLSIAKKGDTVALQAKINDLENKLANTNVEQLEEEINKLRNRELELTESLNQVKEEQSDNKGVNNEEVNQLKDQLAKLAKEYDKCVEERNKLQENSNTDDLISENKSLRTELENLKQGNSDEDITYLKAQLADLAKEYDKCVEENERLKATSSDATNNELVLNLQEQLTELAKEYDKCVEENERLKGNNADGTDEDIIYLKAQLADLAKEYDRCVEENEQLKENVNADDLRIELNELRNEYNDYVTNTEELRIKVGKVDELYQDIQEKDRMIAALRQELTETVPIIETDTNELQSRIYELERELQDKVGIDRVQELEQELALKVQTIEELETILNQRTNAMSLVESDEGKDEIIRDLKAKLNQKDDNIVSLQEKLFELQGSNSIDETVLNLQAELSAKEQQILNLEAQLNDVNNESIDGLLLQITELKKVNHRDISIIAQKDEEIASLKGQLELNSDVDQLRKENKLIEAQLNKALFELEQVKVTKESLYNKDNIIKDLTAKVETLEEKDKLMMSDLTLKINKIREQDVEIQRLKGATNTNLIDELTEKNNKIDELTRQLSKLSDNSSLSTDDAMLRDLARQLRGLQRVVQDKDKEIDNLRNKVELSDNSDLNKLLTEKDKQIKELTEKMNVTTPNNDVVMKDLARQLRTLQKKYVETTQEKEELSKQIVDIQSEGKYSLDDFQELKGLLANKDREIEDLKKQVSDKSSSEITETNSKNHDVLKEGVQEEGNEPKTDTLISIKPIDKVQEEVTEVKANTPISVKSIDEVQTNAINELTKQIIDIGEKLTIKEQALRELEKDTIEEQIEYISVVEKDISSIRDLVMRLAVEAMKLGEEGKPYLQMADTLRKKIEEIQKYLTEKKQKIQ